MRSFYPPLSISTLLYGYLKLLKATRKGKKSKEGFELTPGTRSQDLPHREGRSLTDYAISLFHVRSFITTFYFRYLISPIYVPFGMLPNNVCSLAEPLIRRKE